MKTSTPIRLLCLAALVAAHATLAAAAPRISFNRVVPPPHDLGAAEELAIIYALGDNPKITTFLDHFLSQINRDGSLLHVENATDEGQHHLGDRSDEAVIRKLRRRYPADIYLGVKKFTCASVDKGGDGSTRTVDGEKVRRRQVWTDAVCSGRVDVLRGDTLARLFSFHVKGEGTSPRVAELTDEERAIALEQAARYAAVMAAEGIMPRRVRESIELHDEAPEFDAGMHYIDSGQLDLARREWELSLQRHPRSAAIEYNLAVVCEAIGDVKAARIHFDRAHKLSPNEPRYRRQFELFMTRNRPERENKTAEP